MPYAVKSVLVSLYQASEDFNISLDANDVLFRNYISLNSSRFFEPDVSISLPLHSQCLNCCSFSIVVLLSDLVTPSPKWAWFSQSTCILTAYLRMKVRSHDVIPKFIVESECLFLLWYEYTKCSKCRGKSDSNDRSLDYKISCKKSNTGVGPAIWRPSLVSLLCSRL